MKKLICFIFLGAVLSVCAFGQSANFPGGKGGCISAVANLNATCGTTTGTIATVNDGNSVTDCTVGGGANLVLCRYGGASWGQFTGAAAAAGGSNTQLQWNNATALGGITQFTTNGTTTITGSGTAILDLHAGGTGGLLLPGALATGLVKNTTATGAVSIAVLADVAGLFTGTGLLRQAGAATELSGDVTTSGSNAATVKGINGTLLSGLTTGLLKNTTGTGAASIAVLSDVAGLFTGAGLVRQAGAATEISGDATTSGSNALTLATVNSNVGTFTNPSITVNGKGLATAVSNGTAHTIGLPYACNDTSGSGSAQSCTTSQSFTPAYGDCIVYTTTTGNTGDVTINVNSTSAVHVLKWLGSSVLSALDLAAQQPVKLCLDNGVNVNSAQSWELDTIGNPPSAGGGSINNSNQYSGTYYTGPGSLNTLSGFSAPSTQGYFTYQWVDPTNAAAAPQPVQSGLNGRAISGASTTDTVLYSDVNAVIDHDQAGAGGVTETLPTASTLNNAGFAFRYTNHSTQTDTITPTTWTIQGGVAAPGSTLTVNSGVGCLIKVDPNSASNWLADCAPNSGSGGTVTSGTQGLPYVNTNGSTGNATSLLWKDVSQFSGSSICAQIIAASSGDTTPMLYDASSITGTSTCTPNDANNTFNNILSGSVIRLGSITITLGTQSRTQTNGNCGTGTSISCVAAWVVPNRVKIIGLSPDQTIIKADNSNWLTRSGTITGATTSGSGTGKYVHMTFSGLTGPTPVYDELVQVQSTTSAVADSNWGMFTVCKSGTPSQNGGCGNNPSSTTVDFYNGAALNTSNGGTIYFGTPLIAWGYDVIGDNSAGSGHYAQDMYLVNVSLNCNDIQGCIGFQNPTAQEHSLISSVSATHAPFAMVDFVNGQNGGSGFSNSGPAEDFYLINAGACNYGTIAMHVGNNKAGIFSRATLTEKGCTFTGYNPNGDSNPRQCILTDGALGGNTWVGYHVEGCHIGMEIGANAGNYGTTTIGLRGHSTITNCIDISPNFPTVTGSLFFESTAAGPGAGCTNTVVDNIKSNTLTTDAVVGRYSTDSAGAVSTDANSADVTNGFDCYNGVCAGYAASVAKYGLTNSTGAGAFGPITGTSSITLGTNGGTGGSVVINGSTSGSATINASSTGVLALPSGTTVTNLVATTPNLGVPSALTLTNATGLPAAAIVDGTNGQVLTSGSSSPAMIDLYKAYQLPAAGNHDGLIGNLWALPASNACTVTAKTGTNTLDGTLTCVKNSQTAMAKLVLSGWDTGVLPYVRFWVASTDTTNGHTLTPTVAVSCAVGDGTSYDNAFQTPQSGSTVTFGASEKASAILQGSTVQLNSTSMTNCIKGSTMYMQFGFANGETATDAEFYGATITVPTLNVAGAQ